MKRKLLSLFVLAWCSAQTLPAFAGAIDSIPVGNVTSVTMGKIQEDTSLGDQGAVAQVETLALAILHTVKVVLSGLAVILMVYLGINMVTSLGAEADYKKSKQQFLYMIVAFLFLNVPGEMYDMFGNKTAGTISNSGLDTGFAQVQQGGTNLFLNFDSFILTTGNILL